MRPALLTDNMATVVAETRHQCIPQMNHFPSIHRVAWNRISANFAFWKFSELRLEVFRREFRCLSALSELARTQLDKFLPRASHFQTSTTPYSSHRPRRAPPTQYFHPTR